MDRSTHSVRLPGLRFVLGRWIMGLAGLAADIPALITVSLRLIQQIGICHGYDARADGEQEYVMRILRIGSTASRQAKMESLLVLKPVEQVLLKVSWRKMSEAIARREIGYLSPRAAIQEFVRTLGIQLTRRKALQMAPVVAALISWGIALFECLLQVPANRIGCSTLSLSQLKVFKRSSRLRSSFHSRFSTCASRFAWTICGLRCVYAERNTLPSDPDPFSALPKVLGPRFRGRVASKTRRCCPAATWWRNHKPTGRGPPHHPLS